MEKSQNNSTKTGETPIVEEGTGRGEILGILELRTVLVRYIDGHGAESTRVAVVVPGGEMYFLNRNTVESRPLQTWLKDGIKRGLK